MPKKRAELKEISVQEAEKLLTAQFYGATDLVEYGIFDAYTFAQNAIRNGEIVFHRVNSRDIIMTREQVLDYVRKYRGPKKPSPQIEMKFKCTQEEKDLVDQIVKKVQLQESNFSAEDLFRNCIQELGRHPFAYDSNVHIYKHNGESND